jgi:hypothetical protein
LITGFQAFFFPGVTANIDTIRDNVGVYAASQFLNVADPGAQDLSNVSPAEYGAVYAGPPDYVPDFSGQPDDAVTWWFLPGYDGSTGVWNSDLINDANWTGYPVPTPLNDDPIISETYRNGVLLNLWKRPALAPTEVDFFTDQTGNSIQTSNNIIGANITCVVGSPGTDQWYGANGVGKYGFITPVYDGGYRGEIQWINFLKTRIFFKLNA